MPLPPGTRLGRYEIVTAIGAGGMGEVYRARDGRLGRDVAVKVLPEAIAADPAAASRFAREARAVAALSHPNVLALFDVGEQDGTFFVVTELLYGETLRHRIMDGPVPVRAALDWAIQIAHGLAAAHDKGIIHRDLKPENLFVTRDGGLKVLDFGLARQVVLPKGSPDVTRVDDEHTSLGEGRLRNLKDLAAFTENRRAWHRHAHHIAMRRGRSELLTARAYFSTLMFDPM